MIINWKLYEDKKHQLSQAVAMIFYLIGSADGKISNEEVGKLNEIIQRSILNENLAGNTFDMDMHDARDMFQKDYNKALESTQKVLAEFKGDANISEFLINVAQQLIVADEYLHDREELAMQKICEYLGVSKEN